MKVLTIKNPWAMLILIGLKDVENRSWKTDYRGKLLIHSSKQSSSKKMNEIQDFVSKNILSEEERNQLRYNSKAKHTCCTFGSIIGEVELVDCVQNSGSKWAEEGCWHWILKNPIIYDNQIEVKGKLRLWEFNQEQEGGKNG